MAAGAVRPGDKGPGRSAGKRGSRSRAQSGPEGAAPLGTRGLRGGERAWGGRNTQGEWDEAAGPGVFTLILSGEHGPKFVPTARDPGVPQKAPWHRRGVRGELPGCFFFPFYHETKKQKRKWVLCLGSENQAVTKKPGR